MNSDDPGAPEPADSNRSTHEMSDREIRALLQKHGVDVDQVSLDALPDSSEGSAPASGEDDEAGAADPQDASANGADPT